MGFPLRRRTRRMPKRILLDRGARRMPKRILLDRGARRMPKRILLDRGARRMPKRILLDRGARRMPKRMQWGAWLDDNVHEFRQLTQTATKDRRKRNTRLRARPDLRMGVPRLQPRRVVAPLQNSWAVNLAGRVGWHGVRATGGHLRMFYLVRYDRQTFVIDFEAHREGKLSYKLDETFDLAGQLVPLSSLEATVSDVIEAYSFHFAASCTEMDGPMRRNVASDSSLRSGSFCSEISWKSNPESSGRLGALRENYSSRSKGYVHGVRLTQHSLGIDCSMCLRQPSALTCPKEPLLCCSMDNDFDFLVFAVTAGWTTKAQRNK